MKSSEVSKALDERGVVYGCGSCGKWFTSKEDLDDHDPRRCWDETRECPNCGGLHGYDWDSDPDYKICLGCEFKWDKH